MGSRSVMDDDLRPAYDLRLLIKDGVKGKYAERYRAGTNLVLLDPDVAKAFANDEEKIKDKKETVTSKVRRVGDVIGICEIQTNQCTATKQKLLISISFDRPNLMPTNVCEACLNERIRLGEWEVEKE